MQIYRVETFLILCRTRSTNRTKIKTQLLWFILILLCFLNHITFEPEEKTDSV